MANMGLGFLFMGGGSKDEKPQTETGTSDKTFEENKAVYARLQELNLAMGGNAWDAKFLDTLRREGGGK